MKFWDRMAGTGIVFGHRGASAYAPQNTLPAFELAIVQGAAGIELDVHLSADRYPVVIHDFTVDHTTNGRGLVSGMPLIQLKTLDAGGRFDPKFAEISIPTLDEVFALVGQKLLINVEIKADTDGIEQIVADKLVEFKMQDRVIISSFNTEILQRFRAVLPEVAIGYLYMPGDAGVVFPVEALHPYHEMITAEYMAQAAEQGVRVNTWTVNDPARAVELKRLGVNVIISDKPDVILAALK
ncbi:MAG: glycerophosphodiester phosphodiesterase [Anaerolineae bacterium]|nr:glycerophosphodiester phosphodiesterase [Anaerolineae bacterium]